MVVFDPISVLAGAGPMGAALAWALSEITKARDRLENLTKDSAQAQRDIAIAMSARAETDRSLRYAIDRLRDAFVGRHADESDLDSVERLRDAVEKRALDRERERQAAIERKPPGS